MLPAEILNMAAGAQAATLAPPRAASRRRHPAWGVLRAVVVILVSVTLLRAFVGEASLVPTGSMERTILVGDHIFVNKALYGPRIPFTHLHLPVLRAVRRGDIVAFHY